MRDQTDNRRPEEIESDIERTRADFSSTIDAIQSKLTPSELMDQAVNYALTTTPGAFGANLVHSVRDNPIPVALIGVGIAWLMAASKQSDIRARMPRQRVTRRAVYYPDVEVAYDGPADTEGSGEGILHRAASKTSETGRDLRNKASETGRDLRNKASDVGQRLSGSASEMSGRARDMSQSARMRLQESAEAARARMSDMGQRSQQQYYRAKDRFDQLLDEQPLVVGALGVAIGAALGATLPNTRREDELLGRTRDDLLGRAKETALEQAETVKQTAQRVAQVAKQEVERVKEDVSNAITQGTDQSRPASSGSMEGTQFGGISGQQRPH